MSEKAISIGHRFVASGVYTVFGVGLPVTEAPVPCKKQDFGTLSFDLACQEAFVNQEIDKSSHRGRRQVKLFTQLLLPDAWKINRLHHQIGSDFPFGNPAAELDKIHCLGLAPEMKSAVLGGNFLR